MYDYSFCVCHLIYILIVTIMCTISHSTMRFVGGMQFLFTSYLVHLYKLSISRANARRNRRYYVCRLCDIRAHHQGHV